jgi:hypothetical protein
MIRIVEACRAVHRMCSIRPPVITALTCTPLRRGGWAATEIRGLPTAS